MAEQQQNLTVETLTIQQALDLAVEHHKAGRLPDAENIYQQILQQEPDQPTALHMLGVLSYQDGKNERAIELISRAIELQPDLAEAYNNLGLVQQRLDAIQDAITNYQKALLLQPDYVEAFNNLGNAFHELGNFPEAVANYQKALTLKPDHESALNNLGITLQKLGKVEEALACFRKAATLQSNTPAPHYNRALNLQSRGHHDAALDSYRQALTIQQALDLAVQHHRSGRLTEATALYQQVLQNQPDHPAATHMLGVLAHQEGENELALEMISRVLKIQPDLAEAHSHNGLALRELGRLEDAETSFRKAIELRHDFAEARYNLGMLQLLNGDFVDGWKNYGWRWKMPQHFHNKSDNGWPSWKGDSPQGKTIFISPEQGLGDTIQFVRYVPLITQLGARVILEVPKQLLRLFKHMKYSADLVGVGEPTPPFDYHASLLDLPRLLHTSLETIPSHRSYIEPEPDLTKQWENRLNFPSGFRLGIVWAGSQAHQYDKNRTMNARLFQPLVEIPGVTVYSLQVGRDGESEKVFGDKVVDVGPLLTDFSDTAAVIKKLDLMVTADTAVAHISGAIGCQTRTLIPFIPDWRWLLGRNDTPWYPTMKLVRQPKIGDWDTAIHQVHTELIELVK